MLCFTYLPRQWLAKDFLMHDFCLKMHNFLLLKLRCFQTIIFLMTFCFDLLWKTTTLFYKLKLKRRICADIFIKKILWFKEEYGIKIILLMVQVLSFFLNLVLLWLRRKNYLIFKKYFSYYIIRYFEWFVYIKNYI